MASLRKRGRAYYVRWSDPDGVRHESKVGSDRRVAEQAKSRIEAENDRLRAGLIDRSDLARRDHEATPVRDHLDDWLSGMLAAGLTARHARQFHTRASRVVAVSLGVRPEDIDPPNASPEKRRHAAARLADATRGARLSDIEADRIQVALGRFRDRGKSAQTLRHHLAALRAFCRWLVENGRLRADPTRGVKGFNVAVDRRRIRRALSPGEAERLIQAAEGGGVVQGMTGPNRARLYSLALATGLRAAELGSVTPASFDLTADPPSLTVAAAYAKNRRAATQPLPSALAARLAPWLATLPPSRPIFDPMPTKTAALIRADLRAANVPYRTEEGAADFHSLRCTYVSNLVASGASVKTCQVLARHSSAALTVAVYARTSLHDIRGAVEALPDPSATAPELEAESVASTGTCATHRKSLAPFLPHFGVGKGRLESDRGEFANAIIPVSAGPKPLRCQDLSSAVGLGREEAPGGFEPPMEVLQTSDPRTQRIVPTRVRKTMPDPCPTPAPRQPSLPPDLAAVVDAWPSLPPALRAGIVAMVNSVPRDSLGAPENTENPGNGREAEGRGAR